MKNMQKIVSTVARSVKKSCHSDTLVRQTSTCWWVVDQPVLNLPLPIVFQEMMLLLFLIKWRVKINQKKIVHCSFNLWCSIEGWRITDVAQDVKKWHEMQHIFNTIHIKKVKKKKLVTFFSRSRKQKRLVSFVWLVLLGMSQTSQSVYFLLFLLFSDLFSTFFCKEKKKKSPHFFSCSLYMWRQL